MRPILALATAVALALAAAPARATAATVLAYVEETGGAPQAEYPHPVRDGLLGRLFDLGHIVFDLGDELVRDVDWRTGHSTSLLALATEGRAELIVVARSETRVTPRERGRPLVEVTLSYHVLDASGRWVRSVASGILSATNRGKEDATDATAMIRRLGADAAEAAQAAWSSAVEG
jgi:hypothetical protein